MKSTYSPSTYRPHSCGGVNQSGRIFILIAVATVLFVVILGRLFQLQILRHDEYSETAREQHFGAITLPAKRGEILVRSTHSNELSKFATNTTLDLVYVDPMISENKEEVAKSLTPLLFTRSEYEECKEDPEECAYEVYEQPELETFIKIDTPWIIDEEKGLEVVNEEKDFKTYSVMIDEVAAKIYRKINQSEVDFVVLARDADTDLMAEVINEHLPGIFADTKKFMIYADPTLIPESRFTEITQKLSQILAYSPKDMEYKLTRRKVRYVFLKNRLEPEISRKIRDLNFREVVLLPEHWRFYPEGSLGSHLIGFLKRDGIGQYGV